MLTYLTYWYVFLFMTYQDNAGHGGDINESLFQTYIRNVYATEEIHRLLVNSQHNETVTWTLMFSSILAHAWLNNNRLCGDVRRRDAHCNVTAMSHGHICPVVRLQGEIDNPMFFMTYATFPLKYCYVLKIIFGWFY